MLFHLANYLIDLSDFFSFFRLVNYLTFRSILAALTAVIFIFLCSRRFILFMHRMRFLDQLRQTGVGSHQVKSRTPTMGGVLIIGGVLSSMLLWGNWRNPYLVYSVIGMLWYGALGLWDDWSKIKRKSGDRGISERTKLLVQAVFSLLFAWVCVSPHGPNGPELATQFFVPFYKYPLLDPPAFVYAAFICFFVLFVSNAVNITDGLDGLAITPSLFVMGVLGIFAYVEGNVIYSTYLFYPYLRGAGELTVFGAAFLGAGLAFLWYNAYPAQIFMGDTGSLAIGGSMAVVSVLLKQEMLFPILGGLFVAEALSSQIQDKIGVRWLGKRLFYRAPLHHDLQHHGIAETKVVIRLWIIAGLLALVALATLKLR
ncbi:MAG: phospho-N-acetylmuramoyl-pentapeptide-transferase [Syntrophobacteraceae bacterium CG2_30_61_12]|nr:MAG: phospho-N-acetylmuramoyl-pentapeptide-transferase [Syntrophobacteraceae bacterium CG2_30_61_12]PIU31023.1 MAG: phospho-N-acetylmuramoyl-pentapeptide-transferase [Syntrophobacteraceae bacterium CG07_land_8_20_14_0_80_61_8]